VPAAIKLTKEHGDDLVVILVESQGASAPEAESFAYERGWMSGNALWTLERPCNSGVGSLPSFVLLGNDGEVLLKGNSSSMKGKIEDAIEEQIKLGNAVPEGSPKSAKKAWKSFRAGDFAKAIKGLNKIESKGGDDAAGATALLARVNAKVEAEIERVQALYDIGYLLAARDLASELTDNLEDHATYGPQTAEALAFFSGPDLEVEFAASTAFEKLYSKVREDGVNDLRKKLVKFADKHAGTLAAKRANHLLTLGE